MKNERMLLLCALTVIIVMGSLIIYDCLKPDSLGAQTCVNIKPRVVVTTYSSGGTGTGFGCHSFCAVAGLWGIDDRGDEGFGLNQGGVCGAEGQTSWSFQRGGDVDGFKIVCVDITN